jgi:hypothetical protein
VVVVVLGGAEVVELVVALVADVPDGPEVPAALEEPVGPGAGLPVHAAVTMIAGTATPARRRRVRRAG